MKLPNVPRPSSGAPVDIRGMAGPRPLYVTKRVYSISPQWQSRRYATPLAQGPKRSMLMFFYAAITGAQVRKRG